MPYRERRRLDDRMTRELDRVLRVAFEEARGRVPVSVLATAIAERHLTAFHVERLLRHVPVLLQAVQPTLFAMTQASARLELREMPGQIGASLNMVNPEAVAAAARRQTAALVTNVGEQTKRAIRRIIQVAIEYGLPPRDAARLIRPMIGLTEGYARAVLSLRQRLIDAGATRAAAQAAADRYTRKLLRHRALNIARTETIDALSRGQDAVWDQAQRRGLIPPGAQMQWIVTPDDRLCPLCRQMVGERAVVAVGGYFHTPRGPKTGPPMHPSCRCHRKLVAASLALRRVA